MQSTHHKRLNHSISAIMLVVLIWVLSMGSRSYSFHQWVCGDEVRCVMEHAAKGCEDKNQDPSPGKENTGIPDPLQPFCQSGFDVQIIPLAVAYEPSSVTELSALSSSQSTSRRIDSWSPSRAPPALV